jgi:hypothetical protein
MPVLGRPAAAGLHLALTPQVLQFAAKRLRLHAARTREPVCTARQQGHCHLNPLTGAPSLAPKPCSTSQHLGHLAAGWQRRAQASLLELGAAGVGGAAWTQRHIVHERVLEPSAPWRARHGLQLAPSIPEDRHERRQRPVLWAAVQLGAWVGLGLRAAVALAGAAVGIAGGLVLWGLQGWGLGIFPSLVSPLPFAQTAILPPRLGPELDAFVTARLSEHLRGEGASLQDIVQPEGYTLYPWIAASATLTQRREAQKPSTSPPPSPATGLLHTVGQKLTEGVSWDDLTDAEQDFFAPLCSQAVLLQLLHGDRRHVSPSPLLCRTGRAYSDVPPDVARLRMQRGTEPHSFHIEAKIAWLGELAPPYRYRLRSGQGEDQDANPEQLPQLTFVVDATVIAHPGVEGQLQLDAARAKAWVDTVGACLNHPSLPRPTAAP